MKISLHYFSMSLLRSFAQIMLQGSAITGLLFCIGIALNSPTMLLGGILATLSGFTIAKRFHYNSNLINNGIYGFNSALVGVAVLCFYPVSLFSLTLVILAGALAAIIMHFMLIKIPSIPALTFPFVVTTWLVLMINDALGITPSVMPFTSSDYGHVYSLMRGIGQVMLQDYWLCGAIFIVGLLLHSAKAAMWAVIGSGLGMLIAAIFSLSADLLHQGIYGFNASLVAIALAARFEKQLWPIFIGVMLAVLFTRAFVAAALPALTAPFILASWSVIGLYNLMLTYGVNWYKH